MTDPIPLPDLDEAVIAYGLACMEQAEKGTPRSYAQRVKAFRLYQEVKKAWEKAVRDDTKKLYEEMVEKVERLEKRLERYEKGVVA